MGMILRSLPLLVPLRHAMAQGPGVVLYVYGLRVCLTTPGDLHRRFSDRFSMPALCAKDPVGHLPTWANIWQSGSSWQKTHTHTRTDGLD